MYSPITPPPSSGGSSALVLPKISGNWYPPAPGIRMVTGAASHSSQLRMSAFPVDQVITIDTLGARVQTLSATGNFQLAIYAADPATNRPTGAAIAATGNMSTDVAGRVEGAVVGGAVTLQPGLYFMASNMDNATATLGSVDVAQSQTAYYCGSDTFADVNPASNNMQTVFYGSQTFGTWPNITSFSYAGESSSSIFSTIVFYRVA